MAVLHEISADVSSGVPAPSFWEGDSLCTTSFRVYLTLAAGVLSTMLSLGTRHNSFCKKEIIGVFPPVIPLAGIKLELGMQVL
jgi:hypothetical protein